MRVLEAPRYLSAPLHPLPQKLTSTKAHSCRFANDALTTIAMARKDNRRAHHHRRRDHGNDGPHDASRPAASWQQPNQHRLPARRPAAPFEQPQQGHYDGEHGGYGAQAYGDSYCPDYGNQNNGSSWTAVNSNWGNCPADYNSGNFNSGNPNMGYGGVYGQVPLPQAMPYGMGAENGYQDNNHTNHMPFAMPFPMPFPPRNGFPSMPLPFFPPGFAPPFPPLPPFPQFGFPNQGFGQVSNFSTQAYNRDESPNMRGGGTGPNDTGNGKKKKRKIPTARPILDPAYHTIAREPPISLDDPQRLLIILDLNGTLVYRPNPNRQPTKIEHRAFLREFLQYLFSNFSVMVWSSARPQNVQSMTDQVLPRDQAGALVARWARDSFGLSEKDYNLNVQVYKDLRLVWSKEEIQKQHPQYADGVRWCQRNTVLIDDSLEKAFAQPHNLIDIPEFEGVPKGRGREVELEQRVLNELAGYLERVRYQANVSSFIREKPFTADGEWWYEWPKMEGIVEPKAEEEGEVKVEAVHNEVVPNEVVPR